MTLTTMSSARVCAYWPLSPALPNGVRAPSTNTTSRNVRLAAGGGVVGVDSGDDTAMDHSFSGRQGELSGNCRSCLMGSDLPADSRPSAPHVRFRTPSYPQCYPRVTYPSGIVTEATCGAFSVRRP